MLAAFFNNADFFGFLFAGSAFFALVAALFVIRNFKRKFES